MDFTNLVIPALLNGAKFTVTIAIQAGILAILISIVVGVLRQYNNLFLIHIQKERDAFKVYEACFQEGIKYQVK